MKRILILAGLLWFGMASAQQNVRVRPPRMADCTVIASETSGELCQDTTAGLLKQWNGSAWVAVGSLLGANAIFEGTTANDYETTLAVTDPTADRTVTIPDGSGTVVLSSLATNAPDIANGVWTASNALVFEDVDADASEGSLVSADLIADRTWTLPNATGTVALSTGVAANGGIAYWANGTITCDVVCTTNAGHAACDEALHVNMSTGAFTASDCADATNEYKMCFCR